MKCWNVYGVIIFMLCMQECVLNFCDPGKWWDSGSSSCLMCRAGYFCAGANAPELMCYGGSFTSTPMASECLGCPANSWSGDGATSCTACPSGCTSPPGFSDSPDYCSCGGGATCGDGTIESSEECDDGNSDSGDCCSSSCKIEKGYDCEHASPTDPDECVLLCANEVLDSGEACDDGNLVDNDGCSSQCTIEKGYKCKSGTQGIASVCYTVCGDGYTRDEEQCDDSGTHNSDGCDSECKIETGYSCVLTNAKEFKVECSAICGDEHKLPVETCDDGNTNNFDDCSSDCSTIEVEYVCNGEGLNSNSNCYKCELGGKPNVDSSACTPIPISAEAAATGGASFGVAGLGLGLNIASAVISNASPQSALSSISMMQMLILLPLIGAFMPSEVVQYLASLSMSMLNVPLIKLANLPLISSLMLSFKVEQSNSYLELIGLESGSSLINLINLLGFAILLPLFNFFLYLCKLCTKKCTKCKCLSNFVEKSLKSMMFGAYIRLFYQIYAFILLSTISELYLISLTTASRKISLGVAIFSLICCIALFALSIQQWLKSRTPSRFKTQVYFIELFSGTKNKFMCRSICILFLTRRTLNICLLVLLERLPMHALIYSYNVIQISYISIFVFIRPFKLK